MLRLSKFFITLPLLSLPLSGLSSHVHAEAVLSQMDALRLLAKSRAADSKCRILPADEAEELSLYLARAEVAAATHSSVSQTQSTISVGKAVGDTAACSVATTSQARAQAGADGMRGTQPPTGAGRICQVCPKLTGSKGRAGEGGAGFV